jgi:hypothetical protein
VDGFLSKWYTPYSTSNRFEGLDDNIKTTGYDKGQNSFSVVSIERNEGSGSGKDYARIPILKPANIPPIGVLKTDRKKVFAGMDNVWLGNNNRILSGSGSTEMPYSHTVHAFCSNADRVGAQAKVTYQEGRIGGVSAITEVTTNEYGTYTPPAGSPAIRGFTANDLDQKLIFITSMDETYACYFTWTDTENSRSANASPPTPTSPYENAILTEVPIAANQSTGTGVYVTAQNLADRLAGVLGDLTYHGRDEFTSVSSNTSNSYEKFTITIDGDAFTGSDEKSPASNTTADDGLSRQVTNAATRYGKYFTFSTPTLFGISPTNYYLWLRQTAKSETFVIDVAGDSFSGNNEISAAYTTADDGLTTHESATRGYGNYFTFTAKGSPNTDYYTWFKQAAVNEELKITVTGDSFTSGAEKSASSGDDGLVTWSGSNQVGNYFQFKYLDDDYVVYFQQAGVSEKTQITVNVSPNATELEDEYITLYDEDDNKYVVWFQHVGGTPWSQPTVSGTTSYCEIEVNDAWVNDDIYNAMVHGTTGIGGTSSWSPALGGSGNPFTVTGTTPRVVVEVTDVGNCIPATTSDNVKLAVNGLVDGKDESVSPATYHDFANTSPTSPMIGVEYIDGDSEGTIATKLQSRLVSAFSGVSGLSVGSVANTNEMTITAVGALTPISTLEGGSTDFTTHDGLDSGGYPTDIDLSTGFTFTTVTQGKNEGLDPKTRSGDPHSLTGKTAIEVPYTDGQTKIQIATALLSALGSPSGKYSSTRSSAKVTVVGANVGSIADDHAADGGSAGSGTRASATATFTFGNDIFNDHNNETITLIDASALSRTYVIKNDYLASSALEFNAGGDPTAAAGNLKAAIEASTGHNGGITVVQNAGQLTFTQGETGTAGNTSISHTSNWDSLCSVNPPAGFTGGVTPSLDLSTGFDLTTDRIDGKDLGLDPVGPHSSRLSGMTAIPVDYGDGTTKEAVTTAMHGKLSDSGSGYAWTATKPTSTSILVTMTNPGQTDDIEDGSSSPTVDLGTDFTFAITTDATGRYTVATTHTNKGVIPVAGFQPAEGVTPDTPGGQSFGPNDTDLFERTDSPLDPPTYYAPRVLTAGVDSSDGSIKQKTLTCEGELHVNSRLLNVGKILKMELVNNLENTDSYGGSTGVDTLSPGERIYLQTTLNSTTNFSLPSIGQRLDNRNLSGTICFVSLGHPIVEENSIGSRLLVDATESKVRCSNKSISYFYIDDNKLISGDVTGNTGSHQAADTNNITDKLVGGADFKSTTGTKDLWYTFDWWREHQDANHRYYPYKRLMRAQIEDNHSTSSADDAFNLSPIVHWDSSSYLTIGSANAEPDVQPSDIAKWNYGVFLFTNQAKLRTPNWVDLNANNREDRIPIFGSDAAQSVFNKLGNSSAFDTLSGDAAHYAPDNRYNAKSTENMDNMDAVGPRNALFMARKEKFDRIFVRVSHDRLNASGSIAGLVSDITIGSTQGWPKMRMQVLYPAKKTSNSSTIIWKPLPVIDRTMLEGKEDSSLFKSGDIVFVPPADWEKTSHSANIEYPYEDNFFDDGTASGTNGIDDKWNKESYALIFLITQIASTEGGGEIERVRNVFNIMSMYPYNNSHSQLIEVVDPTHVSLNNFGIAQSVSFTRKGKYQEIKDRSGISLMRRVGAEAGKVKLGGIDLKGDVKTTRVKFNEFQRDSVPVYYDITHKDNSITRLFGVMTEMSEDHPTASVIPKFACSLQITHILEIDSSGNIVGKGYKPLGGDAIDVEQYLSAS